MLIVSDGKKMVTKNENLKLGIDLGGSKIEAVLLDEAGQIVFKQRIVTPADDYRAILSSILGLLTRAEKFAAKALKVGIGTPGAISPRNGLLRNSNTQCLNGQNLLEDLQQTLQRPVRIQNDANCFALSEAIDGAAAEDSMVFGVIIGTGTGGGLVLNKQLISGPHAIAGEWGHNFMPWTQPFDVARSCYCGQHSCIETFLSGPGMAANAKAITGLSMSSRQIVEQAQQGEQMWVEQLDHYYDQMARALAHIINIVDPDAIVLGGGMSNIAGIYQQVPPRLGQYVFSDYTETKLLRPKYGDSSGVRGAAWLWS